LDSPEDLIGQNPMLSSETKRRIDAANDILVGKLPLPTDQVELITLALIYKFMDDLDEQSVQLGGKRSYFIKDLEPYRWRTLLSQKISGTDRVNLFKDGIEALGDAKTAKHLPELFRDVFRNAMLKFRDGQTLTLFLTQIDGFTYSHSEELGNAFEYLLQKMGIQGDNGQFRTPRHIIDFIVDLLEPTPEDKILDPACGTGGFLVSAYKHILAKHTSKDSAVPGDQLTPAKREKISKNIVGYDITPLMVKLSEVNLFLHGFSAPDIHEYDTLSNDARWNDKFDLILANPPFMTPKGGVIPHTRFRIQAKKSEVLFTDFIAEHLIQNGRAGIIVPNGVIATAQKKYAQLRKFLIEDSLVGVVSFPAGIFRPYSGAKTSFLILNKELAKRREKVLFLIIQNDGFDLGARRSPIKDNDLPAALETITIWLRQEALKPNGTIQARLVDKKELFRDKWIRLEAESFFNNKPLKSKYPIVDLGSVAQIISGQSPPSKSYNEEGVGMPFYQGKVEFGEFCLGDPQVWTSQPKKIGKMNDILMSVRAPVGPVNLCTSEICIGRGLAVIRPKKEILRDYLFYFLRANQDRIRGSGGTVFKSISRDQIAEIKIPLPSLTEQERILAKIEHHQKQISALNKQIEEKHMQIQSAFDGVLEVED